VIDRPADGPTLTVGQAVGDDADFSLVDENTRAAQIVEANLAKVQAAAGIPDAAVIRVPTVYREDSFEGARGSKRLALSPLLGMTPKQAAEPTQSAFVPGAVNNLVLGDELIAPRQFAVRVNGKDIFRQAVGAAYAAQGLRIRWIDDWDTYHVGTGEVHCGTNTLRDFSAP
jgi:protein-arginine deiminase